MALIGLMLLLLVIGLPIWFIVRVNNAHDRIDELTRELDTLRRTLWELNKQVKGQAGVPKRREEPEVEPAAAVEPGAFTPAEPPPMAPVIPSALPPEPPPLPVYEALAREKTFEPVTPPPLPEPVAPEPMMGAAKVADTPPEPQPEPAKASFEMRLGTYWLVRVGIVMLLTGLVFFGNYAYHNIVGMFGPAGKVGMLYLASGLLLGAGKWWLRRGVKDSLKDYARVLFAGGLAAVYFTTYAAHHIPHLRVIESATLDGLLLLGWAGFMAWIADRHKSEVLAFFAVGLAYYTSIITQVGSFTLYSNLLLTLVALVFLLRNRWVRLSAASLVATYAGYAYWRFMQGGTLHWALPGEGLWFGAGFLFCYWGLFTLAVFLSRDEEFKGIPRVSFLTLNNAACFALFLLTMWQVHVGGFWKFCLSYGGVLLVLAGVARQFLREDPLAKNGYLAQGLVLVTVGFIAKWSGLDLALILAAESVVLFVLALQTRSRVAEVFAFLTGGLGAAWTLGSLRDFDARTCWLGTGYGALMAFNAVWAHRHVKGDAADEPVSGFRPRTMFFTILALFAWGFTTYHNTLPEHFPLVMAAEAVVLTFSIYLLGVLEIAVLGQGFLLVALGAWLLCFGGNQAPVVPWWNPLLLLVVTLGLAHWWKHQRILPALPKLGLGCQTLFALAVVLVVMVWVHPHCSAAGWLGMTSLLALVATAYGVATRLWPLAICGQIFLVESGVEFFGQLWGHKPEWYLALAPLGALMVLSLVTVQILSAKEEQGGSARKPLLQLAAIYRWVAVVMSLCWTWQYIPDREQAWFLMGAAVLLFLRAGRRQSRETLAVVGVYAAASLALVCFQHGFTPDIYWPNLVSVLLVFVMQQVARRLPQRYALNDEIHHAAALIASLVLWRYCSCWVAMQASGFYLTASWAVLSLLVFGAGMVLRERVYRWIGLGVMAAALARVVCYDIWKQETIYRILTFVALGIALLVLGFVYNKCQEKIREWL